MTKADEMREAVRLERIADACALKTVTDLREYLEHQPETCRDPEIRARRMREFQAAVPRLR